MAIEWERDRSTPNGFRARVTFTGSLEISSPRDRRLSFVHMTQIASSTPGADHFTRGEFADNLRSCTIYAWLNNAAAVAAVTVDLLVLVE